VRWSYFQLQTRFVEVLPGVDDSQYSADYGNGEGQRLSERKSRIHGHNYTAAALRFPEIAGLCTSAVKGVGFGAQSQR